MRKLLLTGAMFVFCNALFLPVQRVSAQTSSSGTLGGLVEDSSKALIPGVGITLTNVQTNVVQKTLTNFPRKILPGDNGVMRNNCQPPPSRSACSP